MDTCEHINVFFFKKKKSLKNCKQMIVLILLVYRLLHELAFFFKKKKKNNALFAVKDVFINKTSDGGKMKMNFKNTQLNVEL